MAAIVASGMRRIGVLRDEEARVTLAALQHHGSYWG
jgi:hypothetical protein